MTKWTHEQLQSIETEGCNIIVSAGAGSGKTAVLTERVIQKLKRGIHIDSLLILTFTRAAAGEMRERIRSSIKEDPLLVEELTKIDSAYITTFDSFALSTVKKYYYLLGVPIDISISDASIMELEKQRILDEVFEEMYNIEDPDFLTLINDFCLKDDADLKEDILNLNAKLDLRYDKEQYLRNYSELYFDEEKIIEDIKLYNQFLLNKIEVIKDLTCKLTQTAEGNYIKDVYDCLNPLFSSTTYDEIELNSFVTLPRLPNGSTDETKKRKDLLVKELKSLCKLLSYKDENSIKEEILSTKIYASGIIKIITRFDEKLSLYKKKNAMYEFTDIAKMAIEVIEKNEDIRNEMRNSFSEILLDEYQDTSSLQEQFISDIQNNNVYMVGDIKQSIYRFRNANPYIFKNKYDAYKMKQGGIKIDLMKNFRSRREVLNNINTVFEHIMDDTIGGAEYQDGHEMVFGNLNYEEIGNTKENHNFEFLTYQYDRDSKYSEEEIEIFTIATDIKNKVNNHYKVFDKDIGGVRDINYSDFVILLDRSKNFRLYKKIFEYLEIPLMIYQDESLKSGYDLDIIKNILRLIVKIYENTYDTEFKYAFMSIARSYLVAMRDEDIFTCINNQEYSRIEFIQIIKELSSELNFLENSEIIEKIIQKFKFHEKLITVGNIEESMIRLEYIYNLSKNFSKLGYDIYDMINYIENISKGGLDIKYSLNTNNTSAVKIMTIHKSKGLEFPICYFPGLYESFNISDIKERFTYSTKYGLLLPAFNNGMKSTIYKKMYKDEYMLEEISEKIRLFYVAMTRAKEKMIFIGNIQDIICDSNSKQVIDSYTRSKYTSFLDIINSIKGYIEPYIININLNELPLTKDYNFMKVADMGKILSNNSKPINVEDRIVIKRNTEREHFSKSNYQVIDKKTKQNMEFGTYIHKIMEMIDFKNPQLNDLKISEFYKNKIKAFLKQPIFSEDVKNIYKEYEFITSKQGVIMHGIIDLLLEYNTYYNIVDYKTKEIDDLEYEKQLKGYKDFIEDITGKPANIYIYSILDEKLKKL